MNMREIEVLCELSNYKNFADAAYSLAYSPSTITKYVSNVENELGIKLLIRSKKASDLVLTPEGKILINAMRRINSGHQYMMELAKQLRNSYENSIRIGTQSRLGNLQEQDIMAAFLAENLDAEIDIVKARPVDLISLLKAGKVDALFLTIHCELNIEEYLREELENSDIRIIYLDTDRNMYLGVSEAHLPGIYEAAFKEFKDFTFAFPFLNSQDDTDTKALSTFEVLAFENGFKLKSMFIGSCDNSIFKLATMKPVAISATNTVITYNGIKFVRVQDWPGGIKLYFLYSESNRKDALRSLADHTLLYKKRHCNTDE